MKLYEGTVNADTKFITDLANSNCPFDSVKPIVYEFCKLLTHIKPELI